MTAVFNVRQIGRGAVRRYLPASGDVHTLEIDAADGLRVDAGFASGTRVSTFYDSMLAKVIGYGPTRDDARRVLAAALARARLHGVARRPACLFPCSSKSDRNEI